MHGSQQTPIPITGVGGLVTLADPTALPEGASPRCHDNDFLVGITKCRPGLTNAYSNPGNDAGPNNPTVAVDGGGINTWQNPAAITLNNGTYASVSGLALNGSSPGNLLNATSYAFNISPSASITGIFLTVLGYSNAPDTILYAQILLNGVVVGQVRSNFLPQSPGTITIGAPYDTWLAFLTAAQANSVQFGVQLYAVNEVFPLASAFLSSAQLTLVVNSGASNFQFITTFTAQNGIVRNLLLDAEGNLYVENVSLSPGTYSLALEGITPGSRAVGVNGPDVEYLAFTNGSYGSDMPLQYTPQWTDRITQVGPAIAPSFSPGQATTNTFAINSITQPPQMSDPDDPGHFQALMWSGGPTTTAPGTVVTVFYSNAFVHSQGDTSLINAFNSGNAVYVYMSNLPSPFVNGTYLITSIGMAVPPGGEYGRWYFTFNVTSSNYFFYGGPDAATGYYQQSLATMATAVPVPGLQVGNQITITGASPSAWNSQWNISQALNSAAMTITSSVVVNSVATFGYAVSTGTPPVAGELVTITGTTNANGALNVTNAVIQSVSGVNTGTFTINVSTVVNAPSSPEDGQATTAGTIFCFDPGVGTLGTMTSPIFGNTTVGGTLTFTPADAQLIGPGTRQGTVFFITRNGFYTAPAPPVTFTCPENTTAINATNIPLGPPNVIARGIAFTEAGQNGVPGANFFNIPTPVQYIVNNTTYTATSLIINDNTTTSAAFSFTDSVLLDALAIDVYGYNLFNNIEIGDPGWLAQYSERMFYGLCWNKVQNFNNLSFDGGYLPALQLVPAGWSSPDIYGSLIVSAKFGNAYYIQNTSGSTLAVAGLISQTAYQDAYQEPIVNTNTAYSVRVTARIPSGDTTGNLVITLGFGGITYGTFTLPFSSMSTQFGIYTGTLLTKEFTTVPSSLLLNVMATNIAAGADVEIDRIDIYPTAIPVLTTTVYGSYAGLPEQVDAVTGQVTFASENQQPINGAMVMYDTFYGLKGWDSGASLYSLQKSSNLEPAQWNEPEVAQRSGGAIGPTAFDLGEQWFLGASRQGLYLFVGGQPGKISQEIYQVWDAINWAYGNSIWVKVDIIARRIYIGVPLPTPNPWLPNAPLNNNPTSPNVILMCNFQGLDSGEALREYPQMHTTMFGTLNAIDMRRKWSIWQIPAPFGNFVETASGEQFYICNGIQNSKVYKLDPTAQTDDGAAIDERYVTAGLPELTKRMQMQQQFGKSVVRWGYLMAALETAGNCNLTLYGNRLPGMPSALSPAVVNGIYPTGQNYIDMIQALTTTPSTWILLGGFSPGVPADFDVETPLNFAATRTFFEFRENDGSGFSLSNVVPFCEPDTWNAIRGQK